MPAQGKVSLLWQLIFVLFVPFLDIWAMYRIKKLRKMIFFVGVPLIISVFLVTYFILGFDNEVNENGFMYDHNSPEFVLATDIASVLIIFFSALALCLTYKWTNKWNKKFD